MAGKEDDGSPTARPAGGLRRMSLEHKLPLAIGGVLLAVILTLSVASYVELRRTAQLVATQRLESVTRQFRDLLIPSSVQLRAQTTLAAARPELAALAVSPTEAHRRQAREAIRYSGPQPDQVLASEIRDRAGRVVLASDESVHVGALSFSDLAGRPRVDSALLGNFRILRDTIVFPTIAPVPGTNGELYLVRWRRLTGSRRWRDQIMQFVGSEASLFLGNADGGQWTDLERGVATPPLDWSAPTEAGVYRRPLGGPEYLVTSASIPGTAWLIAMDSPMREVLAPVNVFVRRILVIAVLALALGLFAAWFASRRITGPLGELTSAADAIAGGDYSHLVHIDRSDELGRLGRAFTLMAREVEHARLDLEHKVEARTRDLNETLVQLHDAQESLVRREKLAMLGQLASGVGHELRNPLGVMTNAIYYLRAVLVKPPANVQEYLEILQQQVTLSEKIVGDLLDFARLKPPQRSPASFDKVFAAQVKRLGPLNGVRIDTGPLQDLPPMLVDDVQIGQIVLNLLTNAVQAIDGPGAIGVRGFVEGDRLQVHITDSGPGIPHENLEKIFEPLFTTKARGIGLGLAVSRTLARANEGDLTVANSIGAGATFRLTLPVAPPSRAGRGLDA